jgi:hypothetical protein
MTIGISASKCWEAADVDDIDVGLRELPEAALGRSPARPLRIWYRRKGSRVSPRSRARNARRER